MDTNGKGTDEQQKARRYITIETDMGNNRLLFHICEGGAHLGFIAALLAVVTAYVMLFAITLHKVLQLTGVMWLSIVAALGAVVILQTIVWLIEEKTNWFA